MKSYRYTEFVDATEMYEHSKEWFSELSFVKDEQQFLNNLIHSFALKTLNKGEFKKLELLKEAIAKNQKRLISILKQVQKHMNQLEIMIDNVNQLEMERAYRKTHEKFLIEVKGLLLDFKNIKRKGFSDLISFLRKDKTIALGNPDYKVSVTKN